MTKRALFSVVLLLAALFGQIFFSMQKKAPTCDEFAHHTASGFSHLVTRDFRMNPAAPPLPRLLSAIPLYFLGVKAPLDDVSWEQGDSPAFAQKFFYQEGFTQDEIIFWARLPILLLSLVFGFFVYRWSSELFGFVGGIASLVLFAFCPDILAHSGLATSDLSVAFFFYMTIWRFWKYLDKQNAKNLVLAGVMAGLAFLSKFSAILIFPTLILVAALSRSWKKLSIGKIAMFIAVCLFVVWAGYGFEIKPLLENTPDPPKKIAVYRQIGGENLVHFAEKVPVPLSTFVSAFSSMMFTRAKGTNAFFMGEWSHGTKSFWQYYFVAFVIKNTIPFLILILFSFFTMRSLSIDKVTQAALLTPVAFLFLVTTGDKAQAGIRYFLPIYPLLFVLCGGCVAWLWKNKKIMRWLAVALLFWHAYEAIRIYPDYLSHFNQLIGGPDQGHRYLRDSNIDWGQDLKGVAEWAHENHHGEITLVTISPVDMKKAYGVEWRLMAPEENLQPGPYVYALGLHNFDTAKWTQHIKPDKIVGHSVWIYDFTKKGDLV